MPEFHPVPAHTLVDEVLKQLRDAISDGTLKPGDRLVEAELARKMNLSRAPVREALRRLEYEGLLEKRQRRGFIVHYLSPDALHEIYELRMLLEPILFRCAATRITDQDVSRLKSIVNRMREAGIRGDWPTVVNTDREFHYEVARLANRPYTARLLEHLNQQVRTFIALLREHYPRMERMADEHDELLIALASRDPDRAAYAISEHLQDARKQLAAAMEGRQRWGTDEGGEPFR